MKHSKPPSTDLMVVTDRPDFLAEVRKAVGEGDGVRVGALDGSPRPSGLGACLASLDTRSSSILLIDAGVDPAAAFLLLQEIFDRQPSPRVFVAGPASDPEMILRALRAGASEFLPVPLDRRNLLDAIQRLWRRVAPEAGAASRKRGQILPFVGSKGGCGTTTVATNLAVTLAARGRTTLLVDLDLGAGDVALLLNLNPTFGIADVVENAHRLDRDLLNGMVLKHVSGLEVLPASENPDRAVEVDPSKIAHVLNFLREQFDYVLVNTPSALDPLAHAAFTQADLIHVVACLDLLSLRRAQWAMRRISQMGVPKDLVRLVVNRFDRNPYVSQEEAEKILDLKVAWTIPADTRTVLEALNEGIPFVSRTQNGLFTCFDQYAGRLAPDARPAAPGARPRRKILGLFAPRNLKQPKEGGALA